VQICDKLVNFWWKGFSGSFCRCWIMENCPEF